VASELSAVEVLSGVKGRAAPLDLALLGTLLFLADGVVRVMRTPEGEDVWFRSAMSAGNLHPVEMYVVSDALGGVYHYDPLGHGLALVRPRRRRNGDDGGGMTVVLSGVPLRTCWRYGARGWRHLWWDAGTVLANILAVSDAHGLDAGLVTSFADADVSEVIGCESVDEVPLVVVRLGPPGRLWPSALELGPAEPSMPVSSRPLAMPQVDAFQLAKALRRWLGRSRNRSVPLARPAHNRGRGPKTGSRTWSCGVVRCARSVTARPREHY
jgi:SagB-type dehydrogenase family enzyme